jgi:PKD repeat protein
MDKRIIWFAVIVVLIGGGLFALRFLSGRSPKDVKTLSFAVSPQTVFVDDSVKFEDNTAGARNWNWDFGDPGGVSDIRRTGYYRFLAAGRYTLRLTVNGKTTDSSITIVVNPRNGPAFGTKITISGPERAYVGDQVIFRDMTPGAQHTMWQNTDQGEVKRDSRTYTTVFTHKGDFQIIAENELNKGTDGQGVKKIHVMEHPPRVQQEAPADDHAGNNGGVSKPAPVTPAPTPAPAPAPAPPPVRVVSDGELTGYFRELASKQDGFRAQYALIKKATGGDESIPVRIVKKDGSVVDKPGLFGGCQYLNMMQTPVSSVKVERDPNDKTSIKGFTVNVNQ